MATSCEDSQSTKSNNRLSPVRLVVHPVPRWMNNAQLYKKFSCFGRVLECNILQSVHGSKGCAFVMFSSVAEACAAIAMMHNVRSLDEKSGLGILQVRYADGEIERLGLSVDMLPGGERVKLFVGCLPKSTCVRDLVNLFSRFGRVDDVHIIRKFANSYDNNSAFVIYPKMTMAQTAIRCLDRQYVMPDGRRAIEVRLAEKKNSRLRLQRLMEAKMSPQKQRLDETTSSNGVAPTICPPTPVIPVVGGQTVGTVPYMTYPFSPVNSREVVVPPGGRGNIGSYSGTVAAVGEAMTSTVRASGSWREYFFADGRPYYYNPVINVSQWETPHEFNNAQNYDVSVRTGEALYNNHNRTYPTAVPSLMMNLNATSMNAGPLGYEDTSYSP